MRKSDETSDVFEQARQLARAERELGVDRWVQVYVERCRPDGITQRLYTYDLPAGMLDRWHWVIRWRVARCQCLYPRDRVTSCRYSCDRNSGLHTGCDHILGRVAAAKAQITKARNAIGLGISLFWCIPR